MNANFTFTFGNGIVACCECGLAEALLFWESTVSGMRGWCSSCWEIYQQREAKGAFNYQEHVAEQARRNANQGWSRANRPPPSPPPPPPHQAAPSQATVLAIGGIRALFEACVPANRKALYRRLAVAFHPDQGGDPAIMVALNDARDRYCPS